MNVFPLPLAAASALVPRAFDLACLLGALGAFLLGNAFLLASPRRFVAERLSGDRPPLAALRESLFQRFLVGLSCAYLCAAFALALADGGAPRERDEAGAFPVAAAALVLVGTLAFVALGAWWSARDFRSLVRRALARGPVDLDADPELAREIGELFGVPAREADTVNTYAQRLRSELGIQAQKRRASPLERAAPFDDEAE